MHLITECSRQPHAHSICFPPLPISRQNKRSNLHLITAVFISSLSSWAYEKQCGVSKFILLFPLLWLSQNKNLTSNNGNDFLVLMNTRKTKQSAQVHSAFSRYQARLRTNTLHLITAILISTSSSWLNRKKNNCINSWSKASRYSDRMSRPGCIHCRYMRRCKNLFLRRDKTRHKVHHPWGAAFADTSDRTPWRVYPVCPSTWR